MDLLKLRQLAVIAKHRSLSEAAVALGVSQPALSKSIRALERKLGVQLLERGRFGVLPTQFGLALARHASAVEAELRTAEAEIEALKSARKGHVSIGCGPSETTRLLPLALNGVRKRAPGVRITALYGLNEALAPMVRHGDVDFALSSIPAHSVDPDLRYLPLYADAAVVVARPQHPLFALKQPLEANQLVGQQWVLARSYELERRALDELFTQASLEPPEASIETTSAVMMKTVVMQSDFLSFLPRELIYWEERAGQLRAINVAGSPWRRRVGVTLRARAVLSPAAKVVIDELRRAAREFA